MEEVEKQEVKVVTLKPSEEGVDASRLQDVIPVPYSTLQLFEEGGQISGDCHLARLLVAGRGWGRQAERVRSRVDA